MIRTTRGLKLLDRLAVPKKAWRLFADVGIRLMFIGMLAMLLIVIVSDISMLSSLGDNTMPEPNKFNEARNIFLIPGVNEFIPFTWGLIALIVTLVVHEFSHAILCRVENIRVKSMGILLALVPVGGFAEPDEKNFLVLKQLKRKMRDQLKEQNPRLLRVSKGHASFQQVSWQILLLHFLPLACSSAPCLVQLHQLVM